MFTKRLPALLPALAAAALLTGPVTPHADAQSAPRQTAASAPASASASLFPSDADLQVMLRYLVEDGATPGIVVGILEPDGSTRILSHGSAGEGTRPLGRQTVFEIGSINKTFTGTLLADMVARGEVKLDDPVQQYMPEGVRVPTRNGRQITLLDLATHRSGLPRVPNNFVPADTGNPYAQYSVQTVYDFLNGHELRRDIGAEYEYSNLGVGLLGIALGRAAGTSVKELIRERIVEPLGMRMTSYEREGEIAAWLAKGRHSSGRQAPYWDAGEAIAGAGGLRANVEDMLLYLRAQLTPPDNALGRAIRQAQQVQHTFASGQAIGLTWSVRDAGGRTILSHSGGTGGFNTYIGFDPERRTGIVMLTNTGGFEDDFAADFMMRGAPLSLPEVRVARDVLARYPGTYEVAPGRPMIVRLEDDGTMTVRVGGNVRFRMYAESDSTFYLKRAPWRVRFTRDASGAVGGLVLDLGGTEQTARRVSDATMPAAPVAPEVLDLPLTAVQMAVYEGTYALQAGGRTLEVRVFVQDGRLMAQPAGQSVTRLRAQGDHAFTFIPTADDRIRFVFTVEGGRATSATLHQNGRAVQGARLP
ncbi:MAG TPA: serine hydrolase [Longimicrobium sp.]|nr:serine hydrolase [Longimicrobium sp.]